MKDWSAEFINGYLSEKLGDKVLCEVTENKGRILTAKKGFKVGDVLFQEAPLHIITAAEQNPAYRFVEKLCKQDPDSFWREPLWYWAAVCSLTADDVGAGPKKGDLPTVDRETQRKILCLYHEEPTEVSEAAETLAKELRLAAPPKLIDELLRAWTLNCFHHSEHPEGYVAYFGASFMSHSCFPNAIWHMEEAVGSPSCFVLKARRDIAIGDEICIAYLSEQGLLKAAATRKRELQSAKHFICTCERCGPGAVEPDLCRGFRCPSCSSGTIFHPSTLQGKNLASAVCGMCGVQVGDVAAKRLLEAETELTKRLPRKKSRKKRTMRRVLTEPDAQQLLRFVGDSAAGVIGPQHWLCDRLWAHLGEWYAATGREEDACRMLHRCTEYQRKAYQGLNGEIAWTLERRADLLLQEAGLPTASTRVQGLDAAGVQRIAQHASRLLTEAIEILQPMFGSEHEYVICIAVKASKLSHFLAEGNWPLKRKRTSAE